jgi:hypothetical protein
MISAHVLITRPSESTTVGKHLLEGKVEEQPVIGRLPTRVDAQAGSVVVSVLGASVDVVDDLVVSRSG